MPTPDVRRTKPYRVEWIGEPGAAVAAFDQLHPAIQYIDERHRDQQHVVIHRGQVIWPSNVRRSVTPARRPWLPRPLAAAGTGGSARA
jgi:hypothetical protein